MAATGNGAGGQPDPVDALAAEVVRRLQAKGPAAPPPGSPPPPQAAAPAGLPPPMRALLEQRLASEGSGSPTGQALAAMLAEDDNVRMGRPSSGAGLQQMLMQLLTAKLAKPAAPAPRPAPPPAPRALVPVQQQQDLSDPLLAMSQQLVELRALVEQLPSYCARLVEERLDARISAIPSDVATAVLDAMTCPSEDGDNAPAPSAGMEQK